MNTFVILNDLDSHLIQLGELDLGEASTFVLRVQSCGRTIGIDPRKILRVIVRGAELGNLMGDDADYSAILAPHKGRLKGGKMTERDKRFGYDDAFWDWWHRVGKPQNSGADILNKQEADKWHDVYTRTKLMIQESLLYKLIPHLNSRERRRAQYVIWLIATRLAL